VWKKTFHLTYDDAKYSKISMAPLLAEIIELLKLARNCSSLNNVFDTNLTRLHLISGHDSTLMPIMASWNVWDGRWASYASMLIVETHYVSEKTNSSNATHVFRLLYNGKVITSKFPGCLGGSQLCDLDVFLSYVEPFATRDRDCKSKLSYERGIFMPSYYLSLIWALFFMIGSCLAGSFATYFVMHKMNLKTLMYSMVDNHQDTENQLTTASQGADSMT
jgi:hypothetical protein